MLGSRKRKSSDQPAGKDSAAEERSATLVLSSPADRSRLKPSQLSLLMRCGTSAQVFGLKSAVGFPTVKAKHRKLLQAAQAPSEAALGAKRTLSDLTGRCQGLLLKKERVDARQRAAIEQAEPVRTGDAVETLAAADARLQVAMGDDTVVGRLVAAARQCGSVDEPARAPGGQPEVPAEAEPVTAVPLLEAGPSKAPETQGAADDQPCSLTGEGGQPDSLPGPGPTARRTEVLDRGATRAPPEPEPDPPDRTAPPPPAAPVTRTRAAGAGTSGGRDGGRTGNRRGNGGPRGQAQGTGRARQTAGVVRAPAAANPTGGAQQQHADPEGRAQARGRISQSVPASAQADWARAATRSLEDVVDAAQNAMGVTGAARLEGALEALAALPARILADNGSSKSRPRRILARLQRISEGEPLNDEEEEEGFMPMRPRRRRVPEQAKLVGRIERHASRGSIRRAAAALDAEPLADTSDPVVMAKLRALHPEADAPAALEADMPAIRISEETLEAVEKRLSAHSRGTAGGVTGWTYEQALVPVRVSSEGRRAVLQFINLILSGKLPRNCFLLESLLVGLAKLKDGVPSGDVRPIAIGEVWYRLAMICALVQKGHEIGRSLGPLQVGVGTKGGVDAVAHAVVTALESDRHNVALSVDCENAFNTLDRSAMFAAVKARMPELLPVVQWAYGAGTPLHIVGAPAGTAPIWSQRGVRQGDPAGPLLFGLTLQKVLEAVVTVAPGAPPVSFLDDITVVGKTAAAARAWDQLCGDGPDSLQAVGLKVRPDKCGVYGGSGLPANQRYVAALAAALGVKHRRHGFSVVGVPIGNEGFVQSELGNRAQKICSLVSKCVGLPLSKQTQFLLLRASLSVRLAHLQRTVPWRQLAVSATRVEQAVLWAAAQIFRLPAGQGPGGSAPVPSQELEQMLLPIRHAGFGLPSSSELGAKAAFLSGAASAQLVMKNAPQMFRPFDGPNRGALEASWQELFDDCAGDCGWPQEVRGITESSLQSALPVAQRDVSRCVADRRAKALLSSFSCLAPSGKRTAARLRSAASAPASAWITATPGPTTRLGDETFVVCGRHRLGLGVPMSVDPPPCLCGAGEASTPDHAMLCKNVAKMTQMRHDIVVSAVRRVVCRASCPSSLEPTYRALAAPHQRGVQPQQQGGQAAPAAAGRGQAAPAAPLPPARQQRPADPGQRRGDILAVLPGGQIGIVDVVVVHPSRQDFLGRSCKEAGYAAGRAAAEKVRKFRGFGDAGQYEFVPFAVESYGRLGAASQTFLKRLGDIAAGRGNISKSAFVRSAYKEVSCALQRGIGLQYARSTLNIARASGRQFMPGCAVPVQEEAYL